MKFRAAGPAPSYRVALLVLLVEVVAVAATMTNAYVVSRVICYEHALELAERVERHHLPDYLTEPTP